MKLYKDGAKAVTGEVVLELRRGDDYSLLDTKGDNFSYRPERLTMESGAGEFSQEDRIGWLNMRNPDIADSKDKLRVYAEIGVLQSGSLSDLRLLD